MVSTLTGNGFTIYVFHGYYRAGLNSAYIGRNVALSGNL